MSNKSTFKRIFPTVNTRIITDSRLCFKIIIGRRNNDLEELEKRRQISEEENIEIMSFDRLTELARRRRLFFNKPYIVSAQMDEVDYEKKNELANPFFECISDAQWKRFCNKGHSHFYTNMIDQILQNRTYNGYFDEFLNSYR